MSTDEETIRRNSAVSVKWEGLYEVHPFFQVIEGAKVSSGTKFWLSSFTLSLGIQFQRGFSPLTMILEPGKFTTH